ncbi:MAG: hypothetical protein WBP34_16280 [Thermoanaerobaculia bacterium]
MDLKLPDSRTLDLSARRLGSIANRMMEDSMAFTAVAVRRLGEAADATLAITNDATSSRGSVKTVPCCPPVEECPPQCLAEITRRAHAGEVILVPLRIHNKSGVEKTWQMGLRPLVDKDQKPAPSQPTLDKTNVTVPPSQSITVEMRIDLQQGFQSGAEYESTIVIREQEINQNVCFRLILDPLDSSEVVPLDETDLKTHFLSWHYHFYCDEKQPGRAVVGRNAPSKLTRKPQKPKAGVPRKG